MKNLILIAAVLCLLPLAGCCRCHRWRAEPPTPVPDPSTSEPQKLGPVLVIPQREAV